MYPWIVFTHVSALVVFLLAHGVSAGVAFRLRREQDPARIGALLEFSEHALNVMFVALAVLVLSGVTAGFVGDWWGRGWIWAALLIILAIIVVMSLFGAHYYNRSRSALGLAYFDGRRHHPAGPATPGAETRLLGSRRPWLLAAVGGGGLAAILYLMLFQPF
jgi:hypothetical protein